MKIVQPPNRAVYDVMNFVSCKEISDNSSESSFVKLMKAKFRLIFTEMMAEYRRTTKEDV